MPGAEAVRSIDRGELERGIHRVRLLFQDAQAYVFGPDTKIGRVNKETAVFLGAGRAALPQFAALYRQLPRRLRSVLASVEARRRLAGREGRDSIGELMTRVLVGAPRLG